MSQTERTALQEWKAHWPLVIAGMIGFSFYSMVTYSLGTFMEPLEQAFGWTRAQISLGLTIFGLSATFAGPVMGAVIDRFGSRRMALFGLILSGATFACLSLATGSITQWVVLWIVFSLCSVMIKSTVWSAGTSSVFTASRGLALAAVLTGSALGQAFAPLVANALIQTQGWRAAYVWIGFGWAGLGAVLVALMFYDAHALGQRRTNAAGEVTRLPGLTIGEACRNSRVIRIAVANLLMSFVGAGITVHLVPLIAQTGVGKTEAAEIAAFAGFGGIAGKFLSGWLLDRVQGSVVPFSSFAVGAIGYFLLIDLFHTPIALLAGTLCLGYSAGAGLQVSTYLISRYAGLRNFGVIFGVIASSMMLGSSFGPLIAGAIHDATGSYAALLWTAMPVMLLCSLMFVGLGPYPTFARPDEAIAGSQLAPAE
ncbi:MFS transporter [Novosphingobium sp. G106]|uniref:MFS transporter n=1 Tax=Novosphingobium sp. G106 TaxID=2849500 RepID=UPI001C2CDE45|nr:MFS transporter [Novosphingobium sp. G106]MBV1686815.1 MFS transporter [Novosphingobium sp. G106]